MKKIVQFLLIGALLMLAFSKLAMVRHDIQVLDLPTGDVVWLYEGDVVQVTAIDLNSSPLECKAEWDELNRYGDFVFHHWTWLYCRNLDFSPP